MSIKELMEQMYNSPSRDIPNGRAYELLDRVKANRRQLENILNADDLLAAINELLRRRWEEDANATPDELETPYQNHTPDRKLDVPR